MKGLGEQIRKERATQRHMGAGTVSGLAEGVQRPQQPVMTGMGYLNLDITLKLITSQKCTIFTNRREYHFYLCVLCTW